jgi:iron-sulfur cluster repair protein YtfE (RIC family)
MERNMTALTLPLHDEHKELLPHVEQIREVAEKVCNGPISEIRAGIEEVYDFLAYHLVAHAQAEDEALYPVVQKVLGSPLATKTMSRDHVEVGRYIAELAELKEGLNVKALTPRQAQALQRVLYGLYGLLKVHFAKEEEVYLPILDQQLTPESAREMFGNMEAAAQRAKHAAHAI